MLVSYNLPGNSLTPPPKAPLVQWSRTGPEEQGLFDTLLYDWGLGRGEEQCKVDDEH